MKFEYRKCSGCDRKILKDSKGKCYHCRMKEEVKVSRKKRKSSHKKNLRKKSAAKGLMLIGHLVEIRYVGKSADGKKHVYGHKTKRVPLLFDKIHKRLIIKSSAKVEQQRGIINP